jgi:hypothetical protein
LSDASQQDRESYGTDFSEVRHEPPASSLRLRIYVAVLVLFPFALILVVLWWMSSATYIRHAQYAYFMGTGYGSKLRHADCDVVVDGDSSALVGVMPKVIEQRTGLKTCNIAEVAGVKLINGMMVLDDYLKHNKRPRFLMFVYAPEDLTPPSEWTSVAPFEGVYYRLQFHPDFGLLKIAAEQPNMMLMVTELGLRTGFHWALEKPMPAEAADERERSGGRVLIPGGPLTRCSDGAIARPPDAAWLAHLRKEYGVDGTQVLIDAMPEPPCDPTLEFYQERLGKPEIDNTMKTMPTEYFTQSGRLHTSDEGAKVLSERLGDQIAALIDEKGEPGSRAGQPAATRGEP